VWYLPKKPPYTAEDERALCLTCKHVDWRYEEEYRLFVIREDSNPCSKGEYSFPKDALRRVICGERMNCVDRAKIKRLARQSGIECFQARKRKSDFGLDIEEYR